MNMVDENGLATTSTAQNCRSLSRVATFPRMRALLWDDNILYAARGYALLRAEMGRGGIEWNQIGRCKSQWWRNVSSSSRLSFRLFRDGFHALAKLSSGHLVGSVPGAIVTLNPGEPGFRISHAILRGTRPLHIAVTPDDKLYWGEYFDNSRRDEVHIYASTDRGDTWHIAYTFPKGTIRHVHNIIHDPWQSCLWILTGDDDPECRILRASLDLKRVETVFSGSQQVRAVAAVPGEDGLYFSSDTPEESNFVYRLDRDGNLCKLGKLSSSSISGCRVENAIFFSTMVEPSAVNLDKAVCVYGSLDHTTWHRMLEWKKDRWPMRFFQYGNAILPDGKNSTDILAVTTVAVKLGDLETSIWRVVP
jgi:hypothetical protein